MQRDSTHFSLLLSFSLSPLTMSRSTATSPAPASHQYVFLQFVKMRIGGRSKRHDTCGETRLGEEKKILKLSSIDVDRKADRQTSVNRQNAHSSLHLLLCACIVLPLGPPARSAARGPRHAGRIAGGTWRRAEVEWGREG